MSVALGAASASMREMELSRAEPDMSKFNRSLPLPYELRVADFEMAMRDVYDFFFDVNSFMLNKGLPRLEDMLRPANLSGTLSDMITSSLAKHSRSLTENQYHNGHPDLLVKGRYGNDSIKAGEFGVEIKSTRKPGGAVDTHGAREQTLSTWVYAVDTDASKPAHRRSPLRFREVYIAEVKVADFRRNVRGELGTDTATLHAKGLAGFRDSWVYRDVASAS